MSTNNCRPGSAWHTWQQQGRKWAETRIFSPQELSDAARKFAAEPGWPQAARKHRYNAFTEGALA